MLRHTGRTNYFFCKGRLLPHAILWLVALLLSLSWNASAGASLAAQQATSKFYKSAAEMPTQQEDADTAAEEAKEEVKEFTARTQPYLFITLFYLDGYKMEKVFVFPGPLLPRHIAPPDPSC